MTLKDFIWLKLANGEYITDSDVAKFLGKEPNFCTVEKYKRQYHSFMSAKIRFIDYDNDPETIICKSGRKYLLKDKLSEHGWFVIPYKFYEYLKNKGVKVL